MHRIGLLAPMRELPGEFADVVAVAPEPTALWQVIVEIADSHDPADLAVSADPAVLRPAAERLARWRPDAVAWGCTSASFAAGRGVAVEQRRTIERAAGAPATSTSLAFVEALQRAPAPDSITPQEARNRTGLRALPITRQGFLTL